MLLWRHISCDKCWYNERQDRKSTGRQEVSGKTRSQREDKKSRKENWSWASKIVVMSVTTFIASSLFTIFLFLSCGVSAVLWEISFSHIGAILGCSCNDSQSDQLDVHSYISAKVMEEEDSSSGSSELWLTKIKELLLRGLINGSKRKKKCSCNYTIINVLQGIELLK